MFRTFDFSVNLKFDPFANDFMIKMLGVINPCACASRAALNALNFQSKAKNIRSMYVTF